MLLRCINNPTNTKNKRNWNENPGFQGITQSMKTVAKFLEFRQTYCSNILRVTHCT